MSIFVDKKYFGPLPATARIDDVINYGHFRPTDHEGNHHTEVKIRSQILVTRMCIREVAQLLGYSTCQVTR